MGEAAAAAPEGFIMHRRIEFHTATNPRAAAAVPVPGAFPIERLFADPDMRVAAAAPGDGDGRGLEKGDRSGSSGFDPELSAARVYLRRIGAGLHNLGNTCYLNSVLQCLTYTEPFVAYLQSGKHKSSCRTAGFCALCALQNHVRSALQSTGKILAPMLFVKNIRYISRRFCSSRQEDAHELMVSLLESMHRSCLPSGVPSESPSAYEKSLVHRIFGGRLKSQVICTRCSHCSSTFDPFLDLSLQIGNASTLIEALHNFTEDELLDGGEKQYNCQQCKQKVVAKKRIIIDKAPSVLTIHLKRFNPCNPLQKIAKMVGFQTTLNLKPFVSNSEAMDLKYRLYGVLVHAGWNTQSGHYYCFVRTSTGIWHNLDDNQVRQVREADVLRQKAYMLFYVRERVRSSPIHKDNGIASLSEKKTIPEKTACVSGTIRNGLTETTLDVSSVTKENTKLQKQNPDNRQPSDINAASHDQCSHEHGNTECIDASTYENNDPVQNSPYTHPDNSSTLSTKKEQTTSGSQREAISPGQPDVCNLDMKLQKQNTCDGQLSDVDATSQDQCTNEHSNIEAIKPSTSQSNEPLEGVPCIHEDGDATLSTKTEQITPSSQMEATSSVQHDVCVVCDASCDHKAYKKPLEEVQQEPYSVLTDSGKEIPAAAFLLCNGAQLFGENEQATESRTDPSWGPTPDSDTAAITQVIPTEDTVVCNEIMSSNEVSTSGNSNEAKEIEPVNQFDELVFMNNIDDELNTEEEIVVPNNTLVDGQAMVKELSVMDTDHMADTEKQAPPQDYSLESGHINCAYKICSEDSAQPVSSEDCAHVVCSEGSVHVLVREPCDGNQHKTVRMKPKKHVKYPGVNFYFGSKQLFLASVKPHEKKKRKRIRRRSTYPASTGSIADCQQTSTSDIVLDKGISCKSDRRKRSRNTSSSEDGVQVFNKKQNVGVSISTSDLTRDKKDSKDTTLASAELASSCPNSIAQPDPRKCAHTNDKGSWHFNLLTRGLRVPRWDGNDMATEFQYSSSTSIGYVLNEWDEEYDRGRRKKVRKSKRDLGGPNPFQETENIRSRQRRRLEADQNRSGHQPLRI